MKMVNVELDKVGKKTVIKVGCDSVGLGVYNFEVISHNIMNVTVIDNPVALIIEEAFKFVMPASNNSGQMKISHIFVAMF